MAEFNRAKMLADPVIHREIAGICIYSAVGEGMLELWKRFRRAGSVTSIVAFIIARYGHMSDNRVLAALIGVFITYHIFFAVLLFTEEKLSGLKVQVALAVLIHFAFLTSFVALCFGLQETPLLPFLKLVLPLLAFLEMRWLFGPGKLEVPQLAPSKSPDPIPSPVIQTQTTAAAPAWVPVTSFFSHSDPATSAAASAGQPGLASSHAPAGTTEALKANAGDYDEFLRLLQQNIRPHRRPGRSLDQEFEHWRAARAK